MTALAAAALVAVAGCSSAATDTESTDSVEVVAIDHQYGSTNVPRAPQRVVTINSTWSDSLVKLDVPITAEFVMSGYAGPGNRFEWTPAHDSTVVEYGVSAGRPDLEELAKFAPDVILAGYVPDQGTYDKLSSVAPTIPVMASGAVNDSWQDVLSAAGRIFDKQDDAATAIAEVDGQLAQIKSKYPAAQGQTFAFGQLTPDGEFGVVTSGTDPSAKLLASVGLVLDPGVESLSANGQRVTVSGERLDLLGSDLLIFWPLAGGPEVFGSIPGWNNLPAVQRGATVFLTNDNAAAFAAPTVYSVPWAANKLEPALATLGQ
ncbi:ABC transporter substrate-binding protein [Tomitella biformata]|uniref:ABC transporter substrate-binding protein n=1 Tax=Tomitella biformata TaxID=630403 RepID=UPI0004AC6C73|nr:ABC transporter substrate-binding protein [Tomitella biformata]